jgi:PIN domain nuclease of toxin-antitoxin system
MWEIAIKRSLGKVTTPEDLPDRVSEEGFGWLPVSTQHAWHVRKLPTHHRDPFDRLLVAQALVEQVPVVTGDRSFVEYGVVVCW